MKIADRMHATLREGVATADGEVRIPAGASVVLTFADHTDVGVHYEGKTVIATFEEIAGSELIEEADE